jgi:hypothetical protein
MEQHRNTLDPSIKREDYGAGGSRDHLDDIDNAHKDLVEAVGTERSVRDKCRLAVGTCDKRDWRILNI